MGMLIHHLVVGVVKHSVSGLDVLLLAIISQSQRFTILARLASALSLHKQILELTSCLLDNCFVVVVL